MRRIRVGRLTSSKVLWLILVSYGGLVGLLSLLDVKPALYGLSTILGTTILGSTLLGTTVMGTTVLGTTILGSTMLGTTSPVDVYTSALAAGQVLISLVAIGMLCYLELSDPSYGRTRTIVEDLRRSCVPLVAFLVVLFMLVVAFRVWEIIV